MSTVSVTNVPDRIDAEILAGRPFEMTIPIMFGGGPVPAVNITSARAQVRPAVGDPVILHTFSTEDEEPMAAISDDGITITATSQETTTWALQWPGQAPETVVWWDLEVTDSDGVPRQINRPGTLTVVHELTR